MKESPVSPSHAKHAENTRATDLQKPSAGHETRVPEELSPTGHLAHCFHHRYRNYLPNQDKLNKKLHTTVFYYAKIQSKFQK